MTGQRAQKDQPSSWPLVLLALPAFVAIWSGWVGLGQMTGFGKVHPLPGTPLADWTLDTSITLPIGMEVYAAYALRVWLAGGYAERARRFAKWSAAGSLGLGAAGQVAYHLMAAAGVSSAPWWITTVVACLPVAVLGMGAALAHLIRSPGAGMDMDMDVARGGGRAGGADPRAFPGAPPRADLDIAADAGGDARGGDIALTSGMSTPRGGAHPDDAGGARGDMDVDIGGGAGARAGGDTPTNAGGARGGRAGSNVTPMRGRARPARGGDIPAGAGGDTAPDAGGDIDDAARAALVARVRSGELSRAAAARAVGKHPRTVARWVADAEDAGEAAR